jgi:vacuolar-type H+-ATPase subunit F/Vma7
MDNAALYFLGETGLANGFRLAGFEVFTDADGATLDELLHQLREERRTAFVVLDYPLANCDSRLLREIRDEGGRILITQVPPLGEWQGLHSSVDAHIDQLLGLAEAQR